MQGPSGQIIFDIIPLQQNAGISFAVPAQVVTDIAEKNNIDLN